MSKTITKNEEQANNLLHDGELRDEQGDFKATPERYIAAAKLGNSLCPVAVGRFVPQIRCGKSPSSRPQPT